MNYISVQVEEFEQGSWVADLVSLDPFDGSFPLGGDTWAGTAVTTNTDNGYYFSRVIGGANKLGKILPDKFYAGSVSLQVAVGDVCRESGETIGTVTPGLFLTTFERLQGKASVALDALANEFGLIWWIDRGGKVNMSAVRPAGVAADGTRVDTDIDGSVVLVDPVTVTLGAAYQGLSPIRHVRWDYKPERFSAQLYGVPFLFPAPPVTQYDCLYSAGVDSQNGDGSVNVIAAGRFGVKNVRLLSGVPGAKIKVNPGELVTLGFFGGDPRQPFAVAMQQDATATKQVARNTDPVKVTITADQLTLLATEFVSAAGPCVYTPGGTAPPTPPGAPGLDITGTIQGGTSRISVGD